VAGPTQRLNPALIRRLNVARVFHTLRVGGPASQTELVRTTGLDAATVSAVARHLRDEGLVTMARQPSRGRAGRPPTKLAIDASVGVLVGARLEPGTVRVLVTTLLGESRATWQGTAGPAVDDALETLAGGVEAALAEADVTWDQVRAVGVGVPALMSLSGRVAYGPNLGWRDVPLQARLQERWSVPVAVDNDTSAAALAETLFGAARDARDFVVIAGHSGIGGALYLGGRLYRGSGGFAGEIGHVRVVDGGRRCGCGGHGCLEAYLAEAALAGQLAERGRVLPTYAAIGAAAAGGDTVVLEVLDEVGALLGRAIADLVDVLDPEMVVLAGALSHVVPWLLPTVERALASEALGAYRSRCRIIASSFGPEAVTMGGVGLAMEAALSLPGWLLGQDGSW
jgi:predicted NBD/HSP70 family sugar kinase